MSGGVACRDRQHEDAGQHVVTLRNANYSAFNGYHYTPSAYSEIRCMVTGWFWRSKAAKVDSLPNGRPDDRQKAIVYTGRMPWER